MTPPLERMFDALSNGPVHALDLAKAVWPEVSPEWADANLRSNVWRLNAYLKPHGLRVRSRRRARARGDYELIADR